MEAIGQLAGGIAHDFNNLLAVILGSASLLLSDDGLREDQVEVVDEIITAADRAAAMTRQLLTFSRKHVTQPKVLAPDHLLDEIAPMLRRLLGGQVTVDLLPQSDEARIRIDRGQFTQVVMNLVVNARDAMPSGGHLTIRVARETEPADAALAAGRPAAGRPGVLLQVSDTGHGIPEGIVERIFDPFFTTKPIGQGSGLGLAVVHGIVTEAGGHLAVESEPGTGTTMRVWLPTCPDGVVDGIESEYGYPSVPPSRILLVEDEELIRLTVARLLRRAGHDVLVAVDGEDALRQLASSDQPVDLMVTDLAMPGMNGLDLAEAVLQRHPATRVLYTSGHAADSVGIAAALARDAAFLPKPYTVTELGKALRLALDPPSPAS
jgi:CheY-like chemotaxis protein